MNMATLISFVMGTAGVIVFIAVLQTIGKSILITFDFIIWSRTRFYRVDYIANYRESSVRVYSERMKTIDSELTHAEAANRLRLQRSDDVYVLSVFLCDTKRELRTIWRALFGKWDDQNEKDERTRT